MKKTILKLCLTLLFGGLLACEVRAVDPVTWEAHELTVDGFGYYASLDKDGIHSTAWGYGGGVTYFLTDQIGVGVDTWADAFVAPYLLDFNGVFRYPLHEFNLDNLAPYGIAGFGRQWSHDPNWFFDFGAGAEFRLQQNFGVFADIRGIFPVDRDPYAFLRFGIRFTLK
jgi:hypothetical protein